MESVLFTARSGFIRIGAIAALSILAAGNLHARHPESDCGTEPDAWREEMARYRRSAARRLQQAPQPATPVGRDAGDIAVMYGSGGVISPPNIFNLAARGISFTPSTPAASRYRFITAAAVYDEQAARSGTLLEKFNDDDTRRLALPFRFPFFGKTYTDIWINSDGNVSFEEGDSASVVKTLGLLNGGPPRIAPLLDDLDPSFSLEGVRVLAEPARFVVTWLEVPEFASSGRGPLQTFQLRLYPDGRMEFAYPAVTAREAVVGIAPGRSRGNAETVSFAAGASQEFEAAVAERFTSVESLDTVLLAQRFYQTHDDAYDYLAVYNLAAIPARSFAVALELTVRSRFRAGFGDREVDIGSQYGSPSRLQAFLNMGPLTQYPRDPFASVPARGSTGDTPLSILAHETGHLFLALASIRSETNPDARPMLGAALAHWSFNLNSDASFLEGNRIEDSGEGAAPRFRTVATVEQYSALDQYLMGFRPAEEVPPTFLVRGSGIPDDSLPRKGATLNGSRRDITVDEIIAAEGRRSPDHTVAQRHFRTAILLVVRDGQQPAQADLDQLERLRSEFEQYFAQATGGRATLSTTLKRNLQLSVSPAAGLLAGTSIQGSVRLSRPAEQPFTVLLRTVNGVAGLPPSVSFAAGDQQALFTLTAIRPGVEEITAEPSDSSYRPDNARIQVTESVDSLTIAVTGGNRQSFEPGQPLPADLEFRVSDINLIPYPGIPVRAVAAGSFSPATAITGPDGIARFRWTPDPAAPGDFTAAIEGTGTAAVATTLGFPAIRANGVTNAASYAPGITPGAISTVAGSALATGAPAAAGPPWPDLLGGTRVLVNGQPAPLQYASATQVNFLAPTVIPGDNADIVVTNSFGRSPAARTKVVRISPGIFANPGTGEASAYNQGQLTSLRPIAPGETLEIMATGLGPVAPSLQFPGRMETLVLPAVFVAGREAEVIISESVVEFPGLYRITAIVPSGTVAGKASLTAISDGVTSNESSITIKPAP